MELKINIGYNELFSLIKQLPVEELTQLKLDLSKVDLQEKIKAKKQTLKSLLLTGPIMTDDEYEDYHFVQQTINI